MKKRKLLFAAIGLTEIENSLEYALELAGTLDKDISILVAPVKNSGGLLEDIFAAAGMAESYGSVTPDEFLVRTRILAEMQEALKPLVDICRQRGTGCEAVAVDGDILKAIDTQSAKDPQIDVVLLAPSVSESGVRRKNLKKLVSGISKPVIKMVRQLGRMDTSTVRHGEVLR